MDLAALSNISIGTASWNIPKQSSDLFSIGGSHLERYASRFPAVEINTSFYRLHKPTTYQRWSRTVPESFRFAVKAPRQLTHQQRLRTTEGLNPFLEGVTQLGEKLGTILIQLPPSLRFQPALVSNFFDTVRGRFPGSLVCEPRHASWFTREAEGLLASFEVARAAADPAVVPLAAQPGGWTGLVYYRLHGSPQIYYSSYSPSYLDALAAELQTWVRSGAKTWCIFDNTAEGAATLNGLQLLERLDSRSDPV